MKYLFLCFSFVIMAHANGQKPKDSSAFNLHSMIQGSVNIMWNAFNLDSSTHSAGLYYPDLDKWVIKDTMLLIKTMYQCDSIERNRFEGWRKKYWALVRYVKVAYIKNPTPEQKKEKAISQREFIELQKQFP